MEFDPPNISQKPRGESHERPTPAEDEPNSAASSNETVTTSDAEAQQCEEWELFSECEDASRPSSNSKLFDAEDAGCCFTDSETDDSDECGHGEDEDGAKETDHQVDPYRPETPASETSNSGEVGLDVSTVLETADELSATHKRSKSLLSSARSSASSTVNDGQSVIPTTSSKIKVFIRIRPPSRWENSANAVSVGEEGTTVRVHSTTAGSVSESKADLIFSESSTQDAVFAAVEPGVCATLEGINATIFAYGQTGTGKTYTMFGDEMYPACGGSTTILQGWGLIPRIFWELCDRARIVDGKSSVKLTTSFLQIYNDRVFDLLTDRKRQKPLILREQPSGDGGTNVILQGLLCVPVSNFTEALRLVEQGRANRSVRETELNSSSSRSHAVVQIHVTVEVSLPNGDKRIRTSRLNLVDLAGSEKWNTDVEMEDHHTIELKNINTSLSALGNCIAALAETGRRHIPYRDSTLTRLLQDSFGGNTMSFLIATISPSQKACEETTRTLQFADRARSVMQVYRVNESYSSSSELLAAKGQIKMLRERLAREQRQRREVRTKEHEAMMKDFAAKLQAKDDELKQAIRDNQVFSKWRDEDTKRIRDLEARIKSLECCIEREGDPIQLVDPNSSSRRTVTGNQGADDRTIHWLNKKVSSRILASRGHSNGHTTSNERVTQPRQILYRSLLNKYNVQKQRNQCPQEECSALGDNNRLSNEENACATSSAKNASQNPVNQIEEWESQLACSVSDSSSISQQHQLQSSFPKSLPMQVDSIPNDQYQLAGLGATSSLNNAGSLPTLAKVVMKDKVTAFAHEHVIREPIAKHTWQLPVVISSSFSEPNLCARVEPSCVSAIPEVCVKHSLKGCVLCAVSESRSQVTSQIPAVSSQLHQSPPGPTTVSGGPTANSIQQPCERHQLSSCFICVKPITEPAWKGSTSFSSSSAPSSSTTCVIKAPRAESNAPPRTEQDTKCSVHLLSNCVLCAGALASRGNGVLVGFNESQSSLLTRLQPNSSWRSGQISPIDPSASSALFGSGSFPSLTNVQDKSTTFETVQPYQPRADYAARSFSTHLQNTRDYSSDTGSNRQFQSLVRDASNAANIVLRRR